MPKKVRKKSAFTNKSAKKSAFTNKSAQKSTLKSTFGSSEPICHHNNLQNIHLSWCGTSLYILSWIPSCMLRQTGGGTTKVKTGVGQQFKSQTSMTQYRMKASFINIITQKFKFVFIYLLKKLKILILATR